MAMKPGNLGSFLFEQFFGKMVRRAALFALLGLLLLIAIYHFTVAGTLALEQEFGVLYARLIIAGVYTAGGLITFGLLLATRPRPLLKSEKPAGALAKPRKMQLAMLVEAVMLGYALSRKAPK
jgi:hypothetical protein